MSLSQVCEDTDHGEGESFEHIQIKRLYPCGEGAGYAGGIVSAAMDGERCAERLIAAYVK
tara:strand:- start:467 stop:646 length:180 start_codon:yes stop_codon:yes gene_type:complete